MYERKCFKPFSATEVIPNNPKKSRFPSSLAGTDKCESSCSSLD